jgi:branched-chain amino acid transport system ATP-binding protein
VFDPEKGAHLNLVWLDAARSPWGKRVKVERFITIARALMAAPKLLILDEPSLGLQPSIVAEVFEKLAGLKRSVSIFVTEQNVRESLRSIDRGYVLENGVVVLEDTAEGLAHNPHVISSYLGI